MLEMNIHVVLSARLSFTCCGSVLLTALVGKIFRKHSNSVRWVESERLSKAEKMLYVLWSKNWKDNFNALLHLIKEFIIAILCEARKQNYTVKTHTRVSINVTPQPEIGVLLELEVGSVSRYLMW